MKVDVFVLCIRTPNILFRPPVAGDLVGGVRNQVRVGGSFATFFGCSVFNCTRFFLICTSFLRAAIVGDTQIELEASF